MRIISSFHDFYDSLMDGSDPNVWKRDQTTVFIDHNDLFFKRYTYKNRLPFGIFNATVGDWSHPERRIPVETMVLIFCGRTIPLWQCTSKIGYGIEGLKNLLASHGVIEKAAWILLVIFFSNYRKMFNEGVSQELAALNLKYKCPVILLREFSGKERYISYVMELNPCLKNLDFQRIASITDTFQTLEHFIFNELVEVDHVTSTGNDKIIAAAKGFGHKYAFRKESQNELDKK